MKNFPFYLGILVTVALIGCGGPVRTYDGTWKLTTVNCGTGATPGDPSTLAGATYELTMTVDGENAQAVRKIGACTMTEPKKLDYTDDTVFSVEVAGATTCDSDPCNMRAGGLFPGYVCNATPSYPKEEGVSVELQDGGSTLIVKGTTLADGTFGEFCHMFGIENPGVLTFSKQ
jgi:hypothetical protein